MKNVVSALQTMSNQTKFSDLQDSVTGVFNTLANSLIVTY